MTDREDLLDTLKIIKSVASCPPDILKLACESAIFSVIAAKLLYIRRLSGDTLAQYGETDGGDE